MSEPRTTSPVIVLVHAAQDRERFLLEWHREWRTFMFPATSPRQFEDADWGVRLKESARDAAVRAVAESAGVLTTYSSLFCMAEPLSLTSVSGSQGTLTGYQPQLFQVAIEDAAQVQSRNATQWLSLEDVLNEDLGPISSVARGIARQVLERRLNASGGPDSIWNVAK